MKQLAKLVTSKFVVAVICTAIFAPISHLISPPISWALHRLMPPTPCRCPYHQPHPVEAIR